MKTVIATLILINCLSPWISAAVIHMPLDQPTIQVGINAAVNGDTVLVAPGIYTGAGNKNLNPRRKCIQIISEDGPENCVIDCENDGRGFYFHSRETPDVLIEGFTIRNGNADQGGGIYCYCADPTIWNCVLTNNHATLGGGIYVVGTNSGNMLISGCIISDNVASESGGGAYFRGADMDIHNCIISMNTAGEYGGGAYFRYGISYLKNVSSTNNSASISGGGIYDKEAGIIVSNSIFWNDQPDEIFEENLHRVGVVFSDIMMPSGTYPGDGNINSDPLLVSNGSNLLCLSQVASGQTLDSPCLDSGSAGADELCYSLFTEPVCMNEWSTRTDGIIDDEIVDMGFHHAPENYITPTPIATPSPTVTPDNVDRIWVENVAGSPDEEVAVEIWISNPDTPIGAFTLYLWWDTDMLTYTHGTRGDLDPGWLMFDCCQPQIDEVVMAGFSSETSIPQGSTGCIGRFYFVVQCPDCTHQDVSILVFENLMDDIATFSPSNGTFTYLDPAWCIHSGDVNFDQEITVSDAQTTFLIMLGIYSPTFEEECAADCNGDSRVTAGDAQLIFLSVLGLGSCADPM
ncbi:right-handed parallel beta-helix repeat-containing protein [bacterium]|nr:right-handed parallel beta-helix repeat-containing protein [bacterium]